MKQNKNLALSAHAESKTQMLSTKKLNLQLINEVRLIISDPDHFNYNGSIRFNSNIDKDKAYVWRMVYGV